MDKDINLIEVLWPPEPDNCLKCRLERHCYCIFNGKYDPTEMTREYMDRYFPPVSRETICKEFKRYTPTPKGR